MRDSRNLGTTVLPIPILAGLGKIQSPANDSRQINEEERRGRKNADFNSKRERDAASSSSSSSAGERASEVCGMNIILPIRRRERNGQSEN